jgi:1-acyl-sn-glycerol-3-phosphate acyltransferase
MIYRLTWFFLRAVFALLFRNRVTGAENVPKTGPVILAGNHVSTLDPPLVATGVWRSTNCMAKEELFKNPLFAAYIRQLGAFPVKRGTPDRSALKVAYEILERGEPLLIFPEGTRSETGELKEPELGIGMIAYRSGAPVVPAYVWGTDQVMPKGGGFRLARIGVTYGQPMRFVAPEGKKPGREEYETAAQQVMAAIADLRDRHQAAK